MLQIFNPTDCPKLDHVALHKQHNSPDSWQYWILIESSGYGVRALEMPRDNVVNMVASWIAKSELSGDRFTKESFLHSSRMILHYDTRLFIIELLNEYNQAQFEPINYEQLGYEAMLTAN